MAKFNALYPGDEGYDNAHLNVEIHGVGDPKDNYVSNSLRFNTKEDAEAYGDDLAGRWFGMDDWRVAEIKGK